MIYSREAKIWNTTYSGHHISVLEFRNRRDKINNLKEKKKEINNNKKETMENKESKKRYRKINVK